MMLPRKSVELWRWAARFVSSWGNQPRGTVWLVAVIYAALGLWTWDRISGTWIPLLASQLLPPAVDSPPTTDDLPLAPLDFSRVKVPVEFTVNRGQTLGGVLQQELGLAVGEVPALLTALSPRVDVRKLQAGQAGLAFYDQSNQLVQLELKLAKGRIELWRSEQGWRSKWQEFQREVQVRRARGEVTGPLETAVRRAGGGPQLAYLMADVLQWDLDFNRDLQLGDRFSVLYEEVSLSGEPAGLGQILALTYEQRNRTFEAYRSPAGDYFDAEGRPLQKTFLRSPLAFSRITSNFSHRRFHPILKIYRPHYGVDYGAPTGTPVRATASGTVSFADRQGGSGKMVSLRHANGFVSHYLHLSGYAPGLKVGQRVRQGEVIGYVGATGLATAPHLDYRVQHHGRWINPLALQNVPADPISQKDLPAFFTYRDALRASLLTGTWSKQPELVLSGQRLAQSTTEEPVVQTAR